MTNLLVRLFIKNADDVTNPAVRERYGVLSGAVGIFCNLLLCVVKFIIGTVTGSVSITADAANNLSDASSSIVTLVGAKAAGKPPDDEHPYGHGRVEYICAMLVAFVILLMGFELAKTSISKIIQPEAVTFSIPALVVLLLSIPVKGWMAYFNRKLGKRIQSLPMIAVVTDSLSDCLATTATIFALVLSKFTKFPVDGYVGVIVALFILYTGVMLVKNTIAPLIGNAPDPDLSQKIQELILSYDHILGTHDLIIHDYGPNRIFASAHAEVPSNIDIMHTHDTIDLIERKILSEFHVQMTIHMDPIVMDDERINETHKQVTKIIKGIDEKLSLHDFRMVSGPTHTNLIFDLVTPHRYPIDNVTLTQMVTDKIKELDENYFPVITVECSYTASIDS